MAADAPEKNSRRQRLMSDPANRRISRYEDMTMPITWQLQLRLGFAIRLRV